MIDLNFLEELEGNEKSGYVPSNTSGVTVVRGFDLGVRKHLDNFRFYEDKKKDNALKDKLRPYLGKIGDEARKLLHDNPLTVTPDEKIVMNKVVQIVYEADFIEVFNQIPGKVGLANLTKQQITSLFCFGYQSGLYDKNFKQIIKLVKGGNTDAFITKMVSLVRDPDYEQKSRTFKELLYFTGEYKSEFKDISWKTHRKVMENACNNIFLKRGMKIEKMVVDAAIAIGEKLKNPKFKQDNVLWAQCLMGNSGKTLAKDGCMVTTMTNVLNEYKNKYTEDERKLFKDPKALLEFSNSQGWINDKGELNLAALGDRFNLSILKITRDMDPKRFNNSVCNLFMSDYTVLVNSKAGHWLEITNCDPTTGILEVSNTVTNGSYTININDVDCYQVIGNKRDPKQKNKDNIEGNVGGEQKFDWKGFAIDAGIEAGKAFTLSLYTQMYQENTKGLPLKSKLANAAIATLKPLGRLSLQAVWDNVVVKKIFSLFPKIGKSAIGRAVTGQLGGFAIGMIIDCVSAICNRHSLKDKETLLLNALKSNAIQAAGGIAGCVVGGFCGPVGPIVGILVNTVVCKVLSSLFPEEEVKDIPEEQTFPVFCLKHHRLTLQESREFICNGCGSECNYIGRFRCSKCDFDLCKNCFSALIMPPYRQCPNEHNLVLCTHRYERLGPLKSCSWICDCCKSKGTFDELHFYCVYCDFDVCSTCLDPCDNGVGELNCPKSHNLYRQCNQGYKCNICGKKYPFGLRVRCQLCDFDICNECELNLLSNTLSKCPKGHNLIEINNRVDRDNPKYAVKWTCDICKKEYLNRSGGYYCYLCDFDLCKNCLTNQERDCKSFKCFKGHPMPLSYGADFSCNSCGRKYKYSKRHRCEECKLNLCTECTEERAEDCIKKCLCGSQMDFDVDMNTELDWICSGCYRYGNSKERHFHCKSCDVNLCKTCGLGSGNDTDTTCSENEHLCKNKHKMGYKRMFCACCELCKNECESTELVLRCELCNVNYCEKCSFKMGA